MKKLRLFSLLMLLMSASTHLFAKGPYVYADPVEVEAGEEAEIVVRMNFDTDDVIIGCTFTIRLPDGVTLTNPDKPTKSCTLSSEVYGSFEGGYPLVTKWKEDGSLLVIVMDQENITPFKSTHCDLVRLVIKSDVAQTVKADFSNVSIINDQFVAVVIDGKMVNNNDADSNTIYVDDMEALVGTEFTLSVKMKNEVDIEGFGFDLILPGGMSVVCDADGNPMVRLSEERTTEARTNTFSAVKISNSLNDAVRVIAASSNGSAIAAGDGEVCTVRVRIGTGLKAGKYSVLLRNISVADTEAVSYDKDQTQFTITVLALAVGDANGDGNVTVADLTAIAHDVLGNTPEGFSLKAADVNQDGQVNVADYTAVAHLLLYGSIDRPAGSRESRLSNSASLSNSEQIKIAEQENMVYMNPATVIAGEEAELSVRMKNAVDAEGFQFALTLPEGVSVVRDADGFAEATLSTERTTAARTNTFATSILPDGTLKVMAASTNGSAIGAGDGEVCTVKIKVNAGMAEGDYALLLSDVAISDTHAKSYNVEPLETKLTVNEASGISEIVNQKSVNRKYFDLQGRRLSDKPQKGVYIEDGRKFVK